MRRLIPIAVALAVIAFLVWAFLPRPVEVDLAEVAPRSLQVSVEEEGPLQGVIAALALAACRRE